MRAAAHSIKRAGFAAMLWRAINPSRPAIIAIVLGLSCSVTAPASLSAEPSTVQGGDFVRHSYHACSSAFEDDGAVLRRLFEPHVTLPDSDFLPDTLHCGEAYCDHMLQGMGADLFLGRLTVSVDPNLIEAAVIQAESFLPEDLSWETVPSPETQFGGIVYGIALRWSSPQDNAGGSEHCVVYDIPHKHLRSTKTGHTGAAGVQRAWTELVASKKVLIGEHFHGRPPDLLVIALESTTRGMVTRYIPRLSELVDSYRGEQNKSHRAFRFESYHSAAKGSTKTNVVPLFAAMPLYLDEEHNAAHLDFIGKWLNKRPPAGSERPPRGCSAYSKLCDGSQTYRNWHCNATHHLHGPKFIWHKLQAMGYATLLSKTYANWFLSNELCLSDKQPVPVFDCDAEPQLLLPSSFAKEAGFTTWSNQTQCLGGQLAHIHHLRLVQKYLSRMSRAENGPVFAYTFISTEPTTSRSFPRFSIATCQRLYETSSTKTRRTLSLLCWVIMVRHWVPTRTSHFYRSSFQNEWSAVRSLEETWPRF